MEFQFPFSSSPTVSVIFGALAAAQKTITAASKDKTNPHFGQKYADLASVYEACREPLASNDIAVIAFPATVNGKVSVMTVLGHKSGEWLSCSLELQPAQNTPQAVGSAITYARRYSLSAMTGVAPDDDDGNEATGNKPKTQATGRREQHAIGSTETYTRAADAQPAKPGPTAVKAEVQPEVQAIWDTMKDAKSDHQALMNIFNEALTAKGADVTRTFLDAQLATRQIDSINNIGDRKTYKALVWGLWKFIHLAPAKPEPVKSSGLCLAKYSPDDRARILAALKKAKGYNVAQVEVWLSEFKEGAARAVEVADGMQYEAELAGQAANG